jgi:hypothetical protein
VDVAGGFERDADRADATVHHVRRRDDVGAGLGVRDGLLDQRFDGDVVDDVTAVVDEAVLAVRGERVERDVGDDAEFGKFLLERAHRALDEAIRIPRLARVERFRLRWRDREQRECGHAELLRLFGDAQQAVDRDALDAGHRRHRFGDVAAFAHEHGQDQVGRQQVGFAHESARERVAAHAAHADVRVGHGRSDFERKRPLYRRCFGTEPAGGARAAAASGVNLVVAAVQARFS